MLPENLANILSLVSAISERFGKPATVSLTAKHVSVKFDGGWPVQASLMNWDAQDDIADLLRIYLYADLDPVWTRFQVSTVHQSLMDLRTGELIWTSSSKATDYLEPNLVRTVECVTSLYDTATVKILFPSQTIVLEPKDE